MATINCNFPLRLFLDKYSSHLNNSHVFAEYAYSEMKSIGITLVSESENAGCSGRPHESLRRVGS
jgi:hypothetical protein